MSPTNTSKAPLIMSQCGNSMFASPTRDECILAAKSQLPQIPVLRRRPIQFIGGCFFLARGLQEVDANLVAVDPG